MVGTLTVRDRGDSPRQALAWFCASEEATLGATAAATKAAKAALAKADSPTPILNFKDTILITQTVTTCV